MVLVTGATGFVGKALLRQLLADGKETKCLVRASSQKQLLPQGNVHVAVGTLQDLPTLRVAMQGVDTVIHLAGARHREDQFTAEWINHHGTANLVKAATDARIRRIVFLSHINADRNSAYPILRGKGAAEEAIRSSGLTYTILRSSLIFGPEDSFTTVLAMLIKVIPFVFPVPSEGKTRFQPIHVEDVVTCLTDSIEADHLVNKSLPIGGPQHLSYAEILDAVMAAMRVHRMRIHLRLPLMRALVSLTAPLFRNRLVSNDQIDLFSIDNTTDLGNVPRNFYTEPRRFTENLGYLRRKGWRRAFLREVYRSKKS